MDDIDFDELVMALKNIVCVYEEEIAPFAVGLCSKLSDAFVKLVNSNGTGENEDQETSLTCDGLMQAIKRVLNSISGKYKELYPQLEEILEQSLYLCLSGKQQANTTTEDGITCISELLFNQDHVSPRMWNFFQLIIDLIINDKGILEEFLSQVSVPLSNYVVKTADHFATLSLNGQQTCLDMMLFLIQKIIKDAKEKEDEFDAIIGVTLMFALLENLKGLEPVMEGILNLFLQELQTAKSSDYKNILWQGISLCLWQSTSFTLGKLE
mmetsp:Transcript_18593/g.17685  ORF Transcript_18593/g.17685 Transcript_18593/m.17685 type:complete len:268 (+) Transcript_18593:1186-1989(+)